MSSAIETEKANEAMDLILGDQKLFNIELSLDGFEKLLLPLLENLNNLSSLDAWFAVTKSWTRGIDVVSGEGELKKLEFKVPALTGTSDLPKFSTAQGSVLELVQNAQREESFMPGAADRTLSAKLKAKVTITKEARDASIDEWSIIFKRYGITDDVCNPAGSDQDITSSDASVVSEYEDV